MTKTPVNIIINCDGEFVVNSTGFASLTPVELKSWGWDEDNQTLILNGPVSNGNNEYTQGSDGKFRRMNHVKTYSEIDFEFSWDAKKIENPVLANIILLQCAELHVKVPLDKSCNIDCTGANYVFIYGNNPNSSINVHMSGVGSIQGEGSRSDTQCIVKRMAAHIMGMGNISGFHALQILKAQISGMGNINLSHDSKCNVIRINLGMGNIKVYPL